MAENWCLGKTELKKTEAELCLAKQLGFIDEPGLTAVEERRKRKNQEIQNKLAAGETVYGLAKYIPAAYLQYELTRFRLDFVTGRAADYAYREITQEEKKQFYKENPDLFTRYFGDMFSYDEVEDIIEKRLREEEYYGLVKNLLC